MDEPGLLLADPGGDLRVVAASSEQAKGKLAERLGLEMDDAFTVLRSYARARNRGLSELARAFIDGSEQLPDLKAGPPPSPRRV